MTGFYLDGASIATILEAGEGTKAEPERLGGTPTKRARGIPCRAVPQRRSEAAGGSGAALRHILSASWQYILS